MALDKLNPKLINTTGASDGDALVFRSANSQIEFGAVSTDTSGLSAGISGANTNINTVQANADAFATYSNSTFGTATNLNTVQANVDTFASYSNSTFASTTYVDTEISNLVNSAPSTLDTLNEIAAALGNDANLSVTLTNQINSISSNTSIVETNLDTYGSYANSTFATSAGIDTYGIKYNFDTATTAADPGTGDFRFSIDWTTGSIGNSYSAYVSETDNDTTGIGPLLDTLTASTNTNKALIVLYKKSNPTINAKFYVTGQTDNGTWRTLDIEYIDRDNWASISNGDEVFMTISLIGDQGDSVTANTNINTVQSNVTIVETNLDTFATYANSTFATSTNLNTVSANVDAVSFGLSGANTNINTISGNLDAYATYANTAFSGGGSGDAGTVEGNLSAFATYANSTFALDTSLNVVQANLDSFATYANSTLATQASVNLVEGNLTAFANYINTNLHYTSEQYTSTASSNSFTLGSSVSDANNLLVSISGVVQSPNDDYIVDGNSLILNNTQPVPADLKVEVRNLAVSGRVPAAGIVGWRYISTNAVTLTANASYFIDVSDGPKTVTLPPSPVLGSTIKIIDVAGLAASNTITVAGNSEKIQRESTDLLVTSNAAGFTLIYSTAAYGWLLGEV